MTCAFLHFEADTAGDPWINRFRSAMANTSRAPRNGESFGVKETIAVVGFAAIGFVVMVAGWRPSASSRSATGTSQFKVYIAGVAILWALLPVVWSAGWNSMRQLGQRPAVLMRRIAPYLACALAGTIAAAWFSIDFAAIHHHGQQFGKARTLTTYAAALIAVVPAFVAMWCAFVRVVRLEGVDERSSPTQVKTRVLALLGTRSALLTSLSAAGALVSVGVLVTGAQRLEVLAEPHSNASYPAAYVLIWGASFSGFLIVNFAPAYRRLLVEARDTIDDVLPPMMPPAPDWQARINDRVTLGGLLKVTDGAKDVINSSVVIAAPLVSSIISLFLPNGG
jgi:hypothetical protein